MHRAPVRPLQIEPDIFMARHRRKGSLFAKHVSLEVGIFVGDGVGRGDGFLEGTSVGCGKESRKQY